MSRLEQTQQIALLAKQRHPTDPAVLAAANQVLWVLDGITPNGRPVAACMEFTDSVWQQWINSNDCAAFEDELETALRALDAALDAAGDDALSEAATSAADEVDTAREQRDITLDTANPLKTACDAYPNACTAAKVLIALMVLRELRGWFRG